MANDTKQIRLPVDYHKLTWQERRDVRKEYIQQQKGLCAHCKHSLSGNPPDEIIRKRINKKLFPPHFFEWPVHLHHDHNTGMTIGAVHNQCNAVLWQYHSQ